MSNKRATLILVDSASRLILRINCLFLSFEFEFDNKLKALMFFSGGCHLYFFRGIPNDHLSFSRIKKGQTFFISALV